MDKMLTHAHSGLRWLVLIFLILAIANAWSNWSKKENYPKGKMPLLTLIFVHLQLILGLALYSMSTKVSFEEGFMKNALSRFYTMEHLVMMVLAIVLITVGYSKAKRKNGAAEGHKTIFTFYLIALLLILAAIPWPFRNLGAAWF